MRLSLMTKYLLTYSLSPFFTGIMIGFLMLLDSPIQKEISSQGAMTYIFDSLMGILTLGFIALCLFFIPALIVGVCLYYLRQYKNFYQLLAVIVIGFMMPFLPLMIFAGFDQSVIGFAAFMGLLGAITGFAITLKLIFFPFKGDSMDKIS